MSVQRTRLVSKRLLTKRVLCTGTKEFAVCFTLMPAKCAAHRGTNAIASLVQAFGSLPAGR